MVQQINTGKSFKYSPMNKWSSALGVLILSAASQVGTAATLCVNGSGTCQYKTISAALKVAKAGDTITVAAGIYSESVVITKSVALLGAGRSSSIINAIGLANGIFINGMSKPPATGVNSVVVSGFTVTNANYEGILVANANGVTITGNLVSGNNRGLNTSDPSSLSCPNIPDFETNEGDDCGEGIHLMAVDHSVIAGNIVRNNAGGILLSDETGPTHDNLIHGNTVSNNVYDCGITLASHSPAAISGLKLPAGVYRNTISGNTSSGNGTSIPGAGAGIGIFAPGPGNQAYGNVVINNTITGNGLPGVTMHNHAAPTGAPAVNMNDNMILANQISGNAADTQDAATPGPTGINIYSVAPVTGTVIAQNVIRNQQINIAVNIPSGAVQAHLNDLSGQTGIDNIGSGTIDGSVNYWGCVGGPGNSSCAGIVGTVVTTVPAGTPF
jgi:parallel beta-helix repeat protein